MVGEHRASFPVTCAAPCGDAPSVTREPGPGNVFSYDSTAGWGALWARMADRRPRKAAMTIAR
jgi:hypothetical protein